ncbi:hypothetical protein C900_03022 [Fulvivirga imtechensis AK7]|uniref:Polymerase nucleotidyl transferase domain-containing protein n=1 Tax=Fulvivirga imtechensis AK7 TaxID=1237149 RepID=L8JSP7_9BACT|nr:nucleotidyltransferase domain-containing protein [Fulvivirga imtechensis]ELR71218.1 hypothetical protein C900_03022 [Fulvivirga imtechensis AK7]
MLNTVEEQTIPKNATLAVGVIKTLLYFDIFNYPLTKEELLFFNPSKYMSSSADTELILSHLLSQKLIYKFGQFYAVQNEPAHIARRLAGNNLAVQKLKTARKFSRFISWFPYVRAVMLSGSISKGYMDKSSDIDFFIVTAPGRLWITRTLLVLFKRIFLLNSHKNFCVNYFIDYNNLEIEEKNLFTAIESITLIPTYGEKLYWDFWTANAWALQYFPNSAPRDTETIKSGTSLIKKIGERLLNNGLGNRLDQYFMDLTLKRWKSLFATEYSKKDFEVAFKTKKYASKNHPRFYQKKILDAYQDKIVQFEKNFNVTLNTTAG